MNGIPNTPNIGESTGGPRKKFPVTKGNPCRILYMTKNTCKLIFVSIQEKNKTKKEAKKIDKREKNVIKKHRMFTSITFHTFVA